MSYAQILAVEGHDWAGALPYVDRAMRGGTYWADDQEKWESLRIGESIYAHEGMTEKASVVGAMLDSLAATGGAGSPADASGNSHDHNGDGVADH
jgi:hypothetical protein